MPNRSKFIIAQRDTCSTIFIGMRANDYHTVCKEEKKMQLAYSLRELESLDHVQVAVCSFMYEDDTNLSIQCYSVVAVILLLPDHIDSFNSRSLSASTCTQFSLST